MDGSDDPPEDEQLRANLAAPPAGVTAAAAAAAAAQLMEAGPAVDSDMPSSSSEEDVEDEDLPDVEHPEADQPVVPAGAASVSPVAEPSVLTARAAALRKAGNDAFGKQQYADAITNYTACLKLVSESDEEATLLSNRSAAYASLCQQYRSRPAERSERQALFGLDPTHIAQLALQDARRAVQLQPGWTKALSRQGLALFLLERYSEAEEVYLQGLSLDPTQPGLQDGLREVAKMQAQELENPAVKRQRVLGKQAIDDMECTLCFRLLFEPVTTPCGHSFCRGCFCRALEHGNKCPLCRTVLHIGRDLPITVTLAAVLEKSFAEEYAERRAEDQGATAGGAAAAEGAGAAVSLPLFVMCTVLPGEKMALNVFEPRYRLMARRCMEGNRRFGMAEAGRASGLEDVACEVEILECNPMPDGRYHIEIIGRRRIRLGDTWELDGYRMARATPFEDAPPAADSPQAAQLPTVSAEVDTLSSALVERLRVLAERNTRPGGLRDFLEKTGQKPAAGRHEALSFWGASVMINYLSDLDRDRLRLMRMTCTLERLTWLRELLVAVTNATANASANASASCSLM